ncbi:MAG: GGDEF domain-containing protein [Ruminococcus sp.]|nr:GGDEF domain-containing protein [Ruminococcus sp.]MCM1480405.1 GGDEF domain-containing protein [Muribaculaceae bacterium]
MSIILVLRSEIACAVILILLLGYNIIYGCKSEKFFLRICLVALAHVIFDGITVFTVNNQELVGSTVNNIMHMLMYLSAVWFGCEIFCYILKNLISIKSLKKYLKFVRLPVLIYMVAMPFLEIQYFQGNGTKYSMGSCTVAGFALTTIYTIIGTAMLIINIRKAEKSVIIGLLPCNIFVLICMGVQLAVVEFLFTGAAVTLVTMGLFFAMENPAAHFMKRAYIDIDTGIKNKNCYNEDMKKLNDKIFISEKNSGEFVCAVCDLNGLKAVNDNFGHIAGDELIRAAADVLSKNLKSAYNVYRIGGDEFVAVFIGHNKNIIEKEVAEVRTDCGRYTNLKHPLSIAIGIADISDDKFLNVFDIISLADKRMYEDKVRIKQSNPGISVR